MIRVIYMSDNPYGGWVTFTAHLMYGLGRKALLYKVRSRTESKRRDFGYGLDYQNVDVEVLRSARQPLLITAVHKSQLERAVPLIEKGAWVVIHDPNEFYLLEHIPDKSKIITIRKSVQRQIDGSVLIPHPYRRVFSPGTRSTLSINAVSVSRIDFDKNTHMILAANRLLPKSKQVQIHGFENRLYGKFKLMKDFPEWKGVQSTHKFPRDDKFAANCCHEARYAVDLSVIKGDGGGTQYTFMEAMDGGAINVLHKSWTDEKGEMVPSKNCLCVESPEELASILRGKTPLENLVSEGERTLLRHRCERVAKTVLEKVT